MNGKTIFIKSSALSDSVACVAMAVDDSIAFLKFSILSKSGIENDVRPEFVQFILFYFTLKIFLK